MNTLKHFIKKHIRKIGFRFFPELLDIQPWGDSDCFLRSRTYNSLISDKAKICPLYHLSDANIDDYTYIAGNSFISMTRIGKFCSIGPNLLCGWGIHPLNGISTAPMFYSTIKQNGVTLSTTDKVEERKPIKIGNDVFIGANVTILDGVTVGDGAVIGAGAVVSKDIPAYAVAVGCPIRILRYRFDEETRNRLLKLQWWEFNDEQLKDVERLFFDMNEFLTKYENEITIF